MGGVFIKTDHCAKIGLSLQRFGLGEKNKHKLKSIEAFVQEIKIEKTTKAFVFDGALKKQQGTTDVKSPTILMTTRTTTTTRSTTT